MTEDFFPAKPLCVLSNEEGVSTLDSKIKNDILALEDRIIKIVFSEKSVKDFEFSKVSVRPFLSKGKTVWQLEQFKDAQVFHKNLDLEQLLLWLAQTGEKNFRQALLTAEGVNVHYTIFPDKIKRKEDANSLKAKTKEHDREKTYILKDGENIPALVEAC